MTEIVESTALPLLARAELDQQVATAKAYPRSIAKFKAEALAMATLDQETAASCFYSLPRGGKAIEGPSIRLAEIVGSAWGNLNYGARVVSIDEKFLTAQGICRDMERNVTMTTEIIRRITDKNGRRYNDDMIGVTANAACSIALRNAIFKVVPLTYAKDILAHARKVAIGDAKTLGARRAQMVEYFGKMGVEPKRILWLLDKPSVEDIGMDEMQVLIGLANAIKDGDTTVDEAFPAKDPKAPAAAEPAPTSKAEQAVAERKKKTAPKAEGASVEATSERITPTADANNSEAPVSEPATVPPDAVGASEPVVADELVAATKIFVRQKGKIRVTRTVAEMDEADWNDAYTEAMAVLDNPDEKAPAKNFAAGVIKLLEKHPVKVGA